MRGELYDEQAIMLRGKRRRNGSWAETSSLLETGGSHACKVYSPVLLPTFNLAVQRLNRLDGMDERGFHGSQCAA